MFIPQKEIDMDSITKIPTEYPSEFDTFCETNGILPPQIDSNAGKALAIMLHHRDFYWTRKTTDFFCKKFNIDSKDSIQAFNKANQRGIKSNSDLRDRGKYYIVYPYEVSNKLKMRKNFKNNLTLEEQIKQIDHIKSRIQTDYLEVPNSEWQLGHKNPGASDNTVGNLVLQPPIQAKYRDNFIFRDTFTKFPMPHTLASMIDKKEIEFTKEQKAAYIEIFKE